MRLEHCTLTLCPTDLPTVVGAEVAHTEVSYGRRAIPFRRESLWLRLLVGGALFAIPLFVYVLLSFLNPLQPTFTTTEAVLALVLLGLVIRRA
jgi:hypothetical protein